MPCGRGSNGTSELTEQEEAYEHHPLVLRLATQFLHRIMGRCTDASPSGPMRVEATTRHHHGPTHHHHDHEDQAQPAAEPLALPSEPSQEEQRLAEELQRVREHVRREQRRNGQ